MTTTTSKTIGSISTGRATRETVEVWQDGADWIVSTRSSADDAPDTRSIHDDEESAIAAAEVLVRRYAEAP